MSFSKRRMAANLLHYSGVLRLLQRLDGDQPQPLRILTYHRVCPVPMDRDFAFDVELVSAYPEEFRWQAEYVKQHYDPVSFRQVLDALDGKSELPPRPVIITFDDGYMDFYHYVFPVLRELGISATLFVSSGYVGLDTPFWFDWVVYLVVNSKGGEFSLQDGAYSLSIPAERGQRRVAANQLKHYLMSLPDVERIRVMEELEGLLNSREEVKASELNRPLSWECITEMGRGGVEFGSHTVSHPILSQLDAGELRNELEQSRQALEQHLDQGVDIIAYPVGRPFTYNQAVIEQCRRSGYRLGVSSLQGTNPRDEPDSFNIRRLNIERDVSRADFVALLQLPEVFK